MRAAICQMHIVWEDKIKNYQKAKYCIQEAVSKSADIILFPEMSFTGFSMNIEKTKELKEETVEVIRKFAVEYSINIGFGWVKGNGAKAENHYTIINPKGEIFLDYIKIHPFSYSGEDKLFISGNELKCCNVKGIGLSAFICYDLRFPELFQAVSKNVSVIIVPANWPEQRREHWRCLLKARAIENQVYILGINCVEENNGQYYSGDSCVIDPSGNTLQELSYKEGLIIQDIVDNTNNIRREFPVKADRKVKLYKEIL